MKNSKSEIYLVGKKAKLNIISEPFDTEVINFLDDFSKSLNFFNKKNYTDIKSLSFFCRKNNILNLKKKYSDDISVRFGLGLLFHITPSNIPTNFAYSLIFGLISGNSNIIKIPSKKFEEIEIICNSLNKVILKKKFNKIREMISIIRYTNDDKLTKKFSLICDARLIWGGNNTIKNIKKFETKPRSLDIPFSDRYSISLINSDKFMKLKKFEIKTLIKKFYNDTYSVDQNACSSPHLILWKGKLNSKAKKKFWTSLMNLVDKDYKPPMISSIDNYSRLTFDLMKDGNIKSFKKFCKSLYVISLKKIFPNLQIEKTKWGLFYECDIHDLKKIGFITTRSLQTLTYFGFSKKFINSFFKFNNFNGIDRIVPIGQALNINFIWDGYNLPKMLSREIEIR